MSRSLLQRAIERHGADAVFKKLTPAQRSALRYEWAAWARPEQMAPPGEWLYWFIKAGRGWGKALALDTPLSTSSGWTTMGDVQVGDELFDELGQMCRVSAIHPVQIGGRCYRVRFSDGSEIIADANHEWLTWDHRARKAFGRAKNPTIGPGIRTTEEISNSLLHQGREANHSIQCCGALSTKTADLTIEPYTLGAWLGDGHSRDPCITVADIEIVRCIESDGYILTAYKNKGRTPVYSIKVRSSQRQLETVGGGVPEPAATIAFLLRGLNLIKNKHIPSEYLRSDYAQRTALLQGLMDTDGYVSPQGHCEFTSTSRRLADGVMELCVSLGLKPVLGTGRAMLNGKDYGPKYRVTFTPYIPVFRLQRKLDRQKDGGAQRLRQSRRYIVDVELVESTAVRCISVDSPSSLFLAGHAMIPTHNSRSAGEWIRHRIYNGARRIALAGPTDDHIRSKMIEDPDSGLLSVFPPDQKPEYRPGLKKIFFHTGAFAELYSAIKPDRARGSQQDTIWGDEIASWRYAETWTHLKFGLRIGDDPRACLSSTPKNNRITKKLVKNPKTVVSGGSTHDNRPNLATAFYSEIIAEYEGTRLGRQEIDAEILDDNPNALWTRGIIEEYRATKFPELIRIGVGVDPQGTSSKTSASTGIVAAGLDRQGHAWVLDDDTINAKPKGWGEQVVSLYHKLKADVIVGEVNNGGDMVEHTIDSVLEERDRVNFKQVRASRGKVLRAEPISALYEKGRVHHVGSFPELEDQMCEWVPGQESPDRLDALVWVLTELMVSGKHKNRRISMSSVKDAGVRDSPWD